MFCSKASTDQEHPPPVPMCSDPEHSDFVSFEGECYYWVDQEKSWKEAEEECVKKNSHLVGQFFIAIEKSLKADLTYSHKAFSGL